MTGRDIYTCVDVVTILAASAGGGGGGALNQSLEARDVYAPAKGIYGVCAACGMHTRGQQTSDNMLGVSGVRSVWHTNILLTSTPVGSTAFNVN